MRATAVSERAKPQQKLMCSGTPVLRKSRCRSTQVRPSLDQADQQITNQQRGFMKNSGQFRKGHDPRRHKFTREECQAGFWRALESIAIRYPNAVNSAGQHMACRFLKSINKEKANDKATN